MCIRDRNRSESDSQGQALEDDPEAIREDLPAEDESAEDESAAGGAEPDADPPSVGEPDEREPQPYLPAGRPGSAEDFAALVQRLEAEVPDELRAQVPWPDLRNPNPIEAQISIFDLWTWMAENYPEPMLVEAMAAPNSPSREEITGIFGRLDADNVLETRTGRGYQAFDHLVVTFESAGLPLWLSRDVPADAVVVYYSDNSDPVDVFDRDTGEFLDRRPAVSTRTWLSIMVPTDVGWQLWRDQLIEPSDSELEVPDVPPPPGADDDRRDPGV